MAQGDRRRRSCSQLPANASEVEPPPPISVATPASLSEGPAPTDPSEVGLNEVGPSEVGSSGINYYTIYNEIWFFYLDHTNDLFIIISDQSSSIVRWGRGLSKNLALEH